VEACGGNGELECRVRALLRAHAEPGSFLEQPAVATDNDSSCDSSMIERPGAVIGPYKLLEQIGEGGFGVVFLAEQTQPVKRKVALKVIKPGMDTSQVVARFEAERQALAMMDHPNIAKVFDAGATQQSSRHTPCAVASDGSRSVPATLGRPYFAMELVQGVPITQYCDQCNLTTRQRLELFITVCQTVQHAHQKGIIHRDLKPTNILVAMQDGRPAPKIIDFGVAKAIHQQLTDQSLATGFAQMLGTPLYMSPEQAELSPMGVDTRSDIYSLGVLLYELLTGTTPFEKDRLHAAGYDELRRIIREEEPPRPSVRISTLAADAATTVTEHRRTDSRRLLQTVRGDLDWIVMKCLEKDRNRRYETADALALDVQRYLAHEPVEARPPSTAYRLQKLVRKHRGAVFASATILGLMISALVLAVVDLARIDRQRQIASAERDRAQANLQLAQQLVQDVLAPASDRLEFVSGAGSVQQVRAELLKQAIAFYERVIEQTPHDPRARLELARLCNRVAAQAYLAGEDEQAICQRSISIMKDLVAEFPDEPTYRKALAESHEGMAELDWGNLRWKQSADQYRAALTVLEELLEGFPDEPTNRNQLTLIHGRVAYALQHSGELAEAEEHYQRGFQDRSFLGAAVRQRYVHLLISQNRFAEAREHLDEALRIIEHAAPGSDWDSALNDFWANIILNEFATHAICMANPREAMRFADGAIDIGEELAQVIPHSAFPANVRGWSYYQLSEALAQSGEFEEAERAMEQALQTWRSAGGRMRSHNTALAYVRLGELQHRDGRVELARSIFRLASEMLEKLSHELPDEQYCQQRLMLLLAHCPMEEFRDPQRAVDLAKRVITESNGPMWRYLALSQYRSGEWRQAQESLQKSMQLRQGGDAMDWLLLAMINQQSNERSQAQQWHARALEAISSGQPIFYGEIGILGFQRLLAEAGKTLDGEEP
jgi:serine/threonine protein kinase/tetratricopeptide (TPR) repeat protein